jgi:hypothetical protein
MLGIAGIPLMPGGVAADPNVTDGEVADCGDEHPATTIRPSNTTRTPRDRPGIAIHLHLRRESTRRQ